MRPRLARTLVLLVGVLAAWPLAAGQPATPRYFPDDPLWQDDDRAFDAGGAAPIEESDLYDFIRQTFLEGGDRRDTPAVNVNTVDETPDSSWFENRIGRREMGVDEIVRGPDRLDRLDIRDWPISAGKPEGLQPGYRVTSPDGRTWQVEFDPPSNPEMATGAEIIGTAFYHAFGYHVVDVYLAEVDPAAVRIAETATLRDPGTGLRRAFTRADLDAVFARAARQPNGRLRAIVSRFADGRPIGSFRYFGTRPDDPNDIHPHEHRRELRGNRVFAAWLNHDDSRGLNSLDMLETRDGRQAVKHYMFDFGSIMGSGTFHAQSPRAGNEYILEWMPGLWTGLSLGFYFKPWTLIRYPDAPPAVGRFEGEAFRPERWKPEYPNPAFDNMRPEDAFWAARIVARFDEARVRAIVDKARYSDPRAADYLTRVLLQRRDKVLRTWLNGVNPLVDPRLEGESLVATNAAILAGVATPATEYRARWFTLDNATGVRTPAMVSGVMAGRDARGQPLAAAAGDPRVVLGAYPDQAAPMAEGSYLGVTIEGAHPEHPAWAERPVTFVFRRTASGWEHVGAERFRAEPDRPAGAGDGQPRRR